LDKQGEILLRQLGELSTLLAGGNWETIPDEWLKHLIDGNKEGWNNLFNSNFDESVSLYRILGDVRHDLRKVKL
jgi:hypothetical protein